MIFETYSCSGPNLHLYPSSFVDLGWSPAIGSNVSALTTSTISGCRVLPCLGVSLWAFSALHGSVVSFEFALVAVSSQSGLVSRQHKHHPLCWTEKGDAGRTSHYGQYPLPPHLSGEVSLCPWRAQGLPEGIIWRTSSCGPNPKGLQGLNPPLLFPIPEHPWPRATTCEGTTRAIFAFAENISCRYSWKW